MRWWCSASGEAWSWTWKPYIGSWIFVAAVATILARAGTFRSEVETKRKVAVAVALSLLLVATEWPLASLGAGYLASAQMFRQVLIVLIAAPLFLYGAPESLGRWLGATARRRAVLRFLTHPIVAVSLATAMLMGVNLPLVVDPLMTSQLGSFLVDLLWIVAGLIMWLPVQAPRPLETRMPGLKGMIYLIVVGITPLPIAFFMTWSEYPLFSVYELAPRVFEEFDPLQDQEFAAALFQVLGGIVIWTQIGGRFLMMASGGRWKQGPRGTFVPSRPASPLEVTEEVRA